jgi:hypothetical protein
MKGDMHYKLRVTSAQICKRERKRREEQDEENIIAHVDLHVNFMTSSVHRGSLALCFFSFTRAT